MKLKCLENHKNNSSPYISAFWAGLSGTMCTESLKTRKVMKHEILLNETTSKLTHLFVKVHWH